jgi:hypothetical protein
MATILWSTPGARSANLAASGQLNGLPVAGESGAMEYNNTTGKILYASVGIRLGAVNSLAGHSYMLRVISGDGVFMSDAVGGDNYFVPLLVNNLVKTNVIPMVRLYPFMLRFSIVNNATQFAASGNELYVTPYGEEV